MNGCPLRGAVLSRIPHQRIQLQYDSVIYLFLPDSSRQWRQIANDSHHSNIRPIVPTWATRLEAVTHIHLEVQLDRFGATKVEFK